MTSFKISILYRKTSAVCFRWDDPGYNDIPTKHRIVNTDGQVEISGHNQQIVIYNVYYKDNQKLSL